jgi:DNA-binding SARP family transcriptional activator
MPSSARGNDRPEEALQLLQQAHGLWRGDPYQGVVTTRALEAEVERLEDLRLAALELEASVELDVGTRPELVVVRLRQLVEAQPLRELLRGLLMLALYRSGRQADALDSYTAGRRLLVERLGIEPGAELRALQQAILEQDPTLVPSRAPTLEP